MGDANEPLVYSHMHACDEFHHHKQNSLHHEPNRSTSALLPPCRRLPLLEALKQLGVPLPKRQVRITYVLLEYLCTYAEASNRGDQLH